MTSRIIFALLLGLALSAPSLAGNKEKGKELRLAATIGDTDTITALLDKGVDINAANKFGMNLIIRPLVS